MNHEAMIGPLSRISGSVVLTTILLLLTASYSICPALAQPTLSNYNASDGLKLGSLNFSNDVINGSSLISVMGVSMVKGIKVTGINLLPNNEISIILRHNSPIVFQQNTSLPRSVTVTVLRAPMDLQNLISMAFAQSDKITNSNYTNNTLTNILQSSADFKLQPTGVENATSLTNKINPFSLIKSIEIGSSTYLILIQWILNW